MNWHFFSCICSWVFEYCPSLWGLGVVCHVTCSVEMCLKDQSQCQRLHKSKTKKSFLKNWTLCSNVHLEEREDKMPRIHISIADITHTKKSVYKEWWNVHQSSKPDTNTDKRRIPTTKLIK